MDEVALNEALKSFEILEQAIKELEKNMASLKKQSDYGLDIAMQLKNGRSVLDLLGVE